ncbi:MAG: ribonuclease R [Lachnospiraceae bacterium]|nr:ribonuclease R [Lachnospiraceae bacterium]
MRNRNFKRDKHVIKKRRHTSYDKKAVRKTDLSSKKDRSAGRGRKDSGMDPIPEVFEDETVAESMKLPDRVSDEEIKGRLDLRDQLVFTIDGDHTRDFDDAVSLSFENGIYTLGVHIADVSHYVKENSALDREALKRGTSVYFPDRVIPMLPESLSNGICSLNEGVDRLTLSCIMKIDMNGKITDHRIADSVIRSSHRMTYGQVQGILDDTDEDAREKFKDAVPVIFQMRDLSKILKEKRARRGALEFETVESEITVDSEGRVTDVRRAERNEATELIEEFMVAANTTVATRFCDLGIPFLYRVHGRPDGEKLASLSRVAKTYGVFMKTDKKHKISPLEMQRFLRAFKGTDEESFISVLALRSMQHAEYSTESTGHFGLAEEKYSHFTSPIRRYPDLQIHRIIKEYLSDKLSDRRISHYKKILPKVAEKSSMFERRAEEAERDSVKLKKCEYAAGHIGEVSDAVISGVTYFGIYAMLPNTVEGMIHISKLPGGYYQFNEEKLELTDSTGNTLRMGQKIKVRIEHCDTRVGNTDMAVMENPNMSLFEGAEKNTTDKSKDKTKKKKGKTGELKNQTEKPKDKTEKLSDQTEESKDKTEKLKERAAKPRGKTEKIKSKPEKLKIQTEKPKDNTEKSVEETEADKEKKTVKYVLDTVRSDAGKIRLMIKRTTV